MKLFAFSLAVVFSLPVMGDELDVINVVAGVNWMHDDNVFRVSRVANMLAVAGRPERWDEVTTKFAGLRIDKPYSLQRFKLDYTRTSFRYKNYDFLNYDANEYKAAWLWSVTPYLTGALSADRSESLNNFQDYRNYTAINIRRSENQRFDADWSPHGNWHLLAGVSRYTSTNSQEFNEESDLTQESLSGGVRYDFPSGSSISLMGYERLGTYDKRSLNVLGQYDTGFDEHQMDLALNWILSGKSRVNLKVGRVVREHDHFGRRDYADPFGSLNYIWTPTGKVQVALSFSRDVASFQTVTSSYTQLDSVSLTPYWRISDKLTLKGAASISNRKFLGDGALGAPDIGREDRSSALSASLTWAPLRSITIEGNVQKSERSSNQPGLDFSDTTAMVSGQLYF